MRLVSLSFAWPGGPALLDGLSLSVAAGSITTLVGTSGCGKSTVLRLVAGLLTPTAGHVEGQQGARAFVFQSPNLLPWLTVRDNVALPLRLHGVPRLERRQRAEEALARVGLTEAIGALPQALSGGMKMRVSLARALVTRPDVLLLDEPFSALDALTRRRMHAEFLALWDSLGCTALMVTHDLEEAVLLSDRVIALAGCPLTAAADETIDAPRPRDRHDPALVAVAARLEARL